MTDVREAPAGAFADRPLEAGERVRLRSLQWKVADTTDRVVALFGREAAKQGRRVQALRGPEPIERLTAARADVHDRPARLERHGLAGVPRPLPPHYSCSQGRGSLGTAACGRLVLEPYQLTPLQRVERLPEPAS